MQTVRFGGVLEIMGAEEMTELLTAAQMRAIEQAAIESGEVTGLELMERAGRGVVEAIFEEWPELAIAPAAGGDRGASLSGSPEVLGPDEEGTRRAVVLCGPGNNGGDGFVVARLLKQAGWGVEVFFYGDPSRLPPDARVNYERWGEMGELKVLEWSDLQAAFDGCALTVEALFGIGYNRQMKGPVWHELFHALLERCRRNEPTVAVDVPMGVHADNGALIGGGFEALLTVTFHRCKQGHYLSRGHTECGKLVVKDIGLNRPPQAGSTMLLSKGSPGLSFLRKDEGHKYSHGHALILSGGVGKGGAARLAARAALRVGAGAVTVGCPPSALIENAAQLNAIMLQRLNDADGLTEVLADERLNAVCIGPGLGLGKREAALVGAVCEQSRGLRPPYVCLDADALTLLSRDETLFAKLHDRCVLTPHAGEFRRLFPEIADKLDAPVTRGPAYSKVDAAREAAKRAGCVVLMKGPDTVIADPEGRCSINASLYERAAPWLATAGSGDVLAGFITGLMARGFPPMQAAETGAWLHTECGLEFGPGLIAEDLPEQLPKVFRKLRL